jgi:hypothetical protein
MSKQQLKDGRRAMPVGSPDLFVNLNYLMLVPVPAIMELVLALIASRA